jgi:hypothetical protein
MLRLPKYRVLELADNTNLTSKEYPERDRVVKLMTKHDKL